MRPLLQQISAPGGKMRRFSHILSFLTVALFILAAASPANADPIDPGIIIQNASVIGTVPVPGNSFSFFTTNGGDCNFTSPIVAANDCTMQNANLAGATWTAISIHISQVIAASLVTCSGGPFFTNACTPTNNADGTVNVNFTGGPGLPPVSPEIFMSIFGWATCSPTTAPSGCVTFDGTISLSSVPEPGTLALLLAGGGFFLARRRRQNVSHA